MTIREILQQVKKYNQQAELLNIPSRARLDVIIRDTVNDRYTVTDYKSFKREMNAEYITPLVDALLNYNGFEPNSELIKLNFHAGWIGNWSVEVYTEIVSYIEEV